MPVWHETTRAARASGDLLVVGIAQEQHPDRCRLYARWQELDWPVLWDPFNLTGSSVVPVVLGVDEHGIVRASGLRPDELVERLLAPDFAPPADPGPGGEAPVRPELAVGPPDDAHAALARLLFRPDLDPTPALAMLAQERERATPAELFRLGVAHRLRHDSEHAVPGDFQGAIDAWSAALAAEPGQYIWRRRLQQYGPRLDKPYPFYDWVEEARAALRARGEEPPPLRAALSGAEVAGASNALPVNPGEHRSPDPGRDVPLDAGSPEAGPLVSIETATVRHTGKPGAIVRAAGATRVHVLLRPDARRDVRFEDEAGPPRVWVAVPRGWRIEANLYTLPGSAQRDSSGEPRSIDFEVVPGDDADEGPTHLVGYALYDVCEGEHGRCLTLRQDFRIEVGLPPGRGGR